MDAAHEVADLLERRLRLLVRIGEEPAPFIGIDVDLLLGRAQSGGESDEALLGAVVEVTLDAPALGLGAVNGGAAAGLQPLDLGGVGGIGARAEQGASERDAQTRHADRDPRCDEHEPEEADRCRAQGAGALGDLEEVEFRRVSWQPDRRTAAAAASPASRTTPPSSGRSRWRRPAGGRGGRRSPSTAAATSPVP